MSLKVHHGIAYGIVCVYAFLYQEKLCVSQILSYCGYVGDMYCGGAHRSVTVCIQCCYF